MEGRAGPQNSSNHHSQQGIHTKTLSVTAGAQEAQGEPQHRYCQQSGSAASLWIYWVSSLSSVVIKHWRRLGQRITGHGRNLNLVVSCLGQSPQVSTPPKSISIQQSPECQIPNHTCHLLGQPHTLAHTQRSHTPENAFKKQGDFKTPLGLESQSCYTVTSRGCVWPCVGGQRNKAWEHACSSFCTCLKCSSIKDRRKKWGMKEPMSSLGMASLSRMGTLVCSKVLILVMDQLTKFITASSRKSCFYSLATESYQWSGFPSTLQHKANTTV